MANKDNENKIKKFTKEAIGKTLNQFNKEIGIADLVEINKNQDRILNGILSQVNDENTEKTEKSNIITLDNSTDGIVELKEIQGDTNVNVSKIEEMPITHVIEDKEGNAISLDDITEGAINIDNIQGNTMVNCNKEADKELILMEDLFTEGYSNITLNKGVNGGKVDVALEGNTMVNVCDQKDPVAITKSYTVETGNHVALQGEYDGKCRPVVTGNTLVNLINKNTNAWSVNTNADGYIINVYKRYTSEIGIKPNTTYTVILSEMANSCTGYTLFQYVNNEGISKIINKELINNKYFTINITDIDTALNSIVIYQKYNIQDGNTLPSQNSNFYILEGDYTNKPIPEYFEGLQSSFEDKVVTQEMVDNGEELAENLGKYRVDYKVTGKNKISYTELGDMYNDSGYPTSSSTISRTGFIKVRKNTTYKFSVNYPTNGTWHTVFFFDENKKFIKRADSINTINTSYASYLRIKCSNPNGETWTPQLEEGSTATAYEPYKEFTKTYYLNSPLLEGDTIEEQGDNVVHVHRYKEVVLDGSENWAYIPSSNAPTNTDYTIFTLNTEDYKVKGDIISSNIPVPERKYITADYPNIFAIGGHTTNNQIRICIEKSKLPTPSLNSFKTWLQQNPTTVVYELQTPQYEVISENDSILCDSYVNGHLDVDSVVPIEKVVFDNWKCQLKYVYTDTNYILQFEADNIGTSRIAFSGNLIHNGVINKGINKISGKFTDSNPWLHFNGIGFNASNIVVTEATDQDFGYFEGMKSVGECEDLAVVSSNSDNSQSNAQTLTHEPLRAVEDIKDKYVLIDGKWYIERNCAEVVGADDFRKNNKKPDTLGCRFTIISDKILKRTYGKHSIKCNIIPTNTKSSAYSAEGFYVTNDEDKKISIRLENDMTVEEFKTKFSNLKITYQLKTPTYEPIDYNPFEVYSEVTHISNNSTIPCNMTIKNTGYNCLLKPNTTYTVSSNLGLNTVTTPSVLTEDCLRFYDTDTSSVTTMKNVTILEGDYTTGKPIPSHFSGIESAFEQEYDETVGKYKVKVRVQNEDASKENYIEFYINEPLRGIGDVKDKVYVKNDKVVVERNCGSVTLDGSENWYYNKTVFPYIEFYLPNSSVPSGVNMPCMSDKFTNLDKKIEKLVIAYRQFYLQLYSSKLQTQDVSGFRQYLQQNPVTVVYQLAEPTYEEIEYSESRLLLNTYNNSTLFYESNIPVSNTSFKPLWEELVYLKNSTRYYIQFNSTAGGTVVFNLGGTEVTKDIVEGYNNIAIDTPAETTNLLTIDGHGINISEVVVSEVICGGYYKGLQSCFEEHMENGKYRILLRGIALDGSKVNGIKLYINEPLRGIKDTRDRLCIKDGKLMVERKYGSVILGCTGNIWDTTAWGASSDKTIEFRLGYNQFENKEGKILCDNFISETSNLWVMDTEGIQSYTVDTVDIRINKTRLSTQDVAGFRQWLQQNPTTIVYKLVTPQYEEVTNEYGLPIVFEGYENGIVYVDSAVTPTTHIKYTSNNQLATTLSEAEEQNIATQEDINMNVVTYMMDIDMILTEMEMSNDTSVMAVRRDSSNENMLDRMSEEDKKVYRDNTVVMLEKMITANVLEKEDIEGRINMYYDKNRISKEQYEYLKSLL